ncbi:dynamin family protein [Calditerrivibrio nitroreducens]|uniref:Dynamin N-terminal domain-containing protein n=1 Tax=Calditerrivibrio nitroreducens (strain DSM 19672 / NBRC 101217 / Yu37-1) TaxID=768670 RepID=E4TK93_CALNY|nr:dynamin family protein [Calditerrivibrio nitroreducens]ADR19965.1 hypothetical protein Calni_2073 [Calditerrivibrio nitroreducens DSM 19672]
MELLKLFREVEAVVDKNYTILKDDAENLKEDLALEKLEDLEKQLADLDRDSKTLTIGIVGRVKAGKSSLLNALLFEGESILPKAATPMTASLTLLSYDDKISAEVEFYTQKDVKEIKKKHDEYLTKLNDLKEKYIEQFKNDEKELQSGNIEKKAEDMAKKELFEKYIHLQAAYEHYNDMENKGLNQNFSNNEVISADSLEELSKKLLDYVGSQGKYTPYTKSVRIKAPLESLKGVEIVDTPGINDPVVSREARTRELLKNADVVFILSNAGQFLSEEDLDLMDRITMKEGIRELFLVGSQVDLQLHGDEKIKSRGNLFTALENIKKNLADYTRRTIKDLKRNSPEIGDTYNQLIEESKERMFLSSGACYSLYKLFDNKQLWDDNMKIVWKNLTNNYPDFFSEDNKDIALENLKLLSGIVEIVEALEKVKERKQEILKKRSEEIMKAKSQSLRKYIDGLIKAVEERLTKIQSTEIKDLEKNIQELQKKTSNSGVVEHKYDELVEELIDDIKKISRKITMDISKSIYDLQNVGEGYKTEPKNEGRGGLLGFLADFLFGEKKVEENVRILKTGYVEAELVKSVNNQKISTEEKLEEAIKQWKVKLRRELTSTIREVVGDEFIDKDIMIKSITSIEKSEIDFPSLDDITIPSSLRRRGILKNEDEIEDYRSKLTDFLDDLESEFKDNLNEFSKTIKKNLGEKGSKVIKSIFDKYRIEIENLRKDIESKQFMIDKLNNTSKELKNLKKKVLLQEV